MHYQLYLRYPMANLQLGSHLLPDDEGHGYYGGLPQNDGVEIPAS